MAFQVKVQFTGLQEILKRLDAVEKKVRKKILRKAIGAANKIVLKAAKAKVRKGATGLLKKSLGSRIKVYRQGGVVVGIVGPRSGFKKTREGRAQTSLGAKFAAAGSRPTLYAHLVEGGRKAVSAGTKSVKGKGGKARTKATGKKSLAFTAGGKTVFARQVRAVPPRPFMRPALTSTAGKVENVMRQIILHGIEEAARS